MRRFESTLSTTSIKYNPISWGDLRGLSHFGDESKLSPEIAGLVTRADGGDVTERDRKKVETWLAARPQVTEFSMGTLKPADSPEFLPIGSEDDE